MQYKIGDEVVLRPETKPYTFREDYSDEIKIKELDSYVYDDFIYTVKDVFEDGDLLIAHDGYNITHIAPWHLKHAKEDTAFEDYHEKLHQQYSDSFNKLESDMKEKLERLEDTNIGSKSNPEWAIKESLKVIIPLAKDSGMTNQDFIDLIDKY